MTLGPDHYTPIQKRTHVADPVPYLVVDGRGHDDIAYTEEAAQRAPLITRGWDALAGWYAGTGNPFTL